MSAAGDQLRAIAKVHDVLEESREKLIEELLPARRQITQLKTVNEDLLAANRELQRRVDEFKAPEKPKPKMLFKDSLIAIPKDLRDGGPYLLDAAPNSFRIVNDFDSVCLGVVLRRDGPLDKNGTRRRAEFGLPVIGADSRIYKRDVYGKTFRYALKLRFPVVDFDDPNKIVVCQWHGGKPEPGDKSQRNPPLSLEFNRKKRELRLVLAPFENTERKILWERKGISPLEWLSFSFSAVWSQKRSEGHLNAYLNGMEIVDHVGQNAYDDTPGYVFFRCGIYSPSYTDISVSIPDNAWHEVFYRDLEIEEL